MGNIETATKFSRLKSISSTEGNYSFTLVISITIKTITLYCEEDYH